MATLLADVCFHGDFRRPKRAILIKNECTRATLTQGAAQSDSIIARSQRSKEFCNTFGVTADIGQPLLTNLDL
jgi:hypothetical protein